MLTQDDETRIMRAVRDGVWRAFFRIVLVMTLAVILWALLSPGSCLEAIK